MLVARWRSSSSTLGFPLRGLRWAHAPARDRLPHRRARTRPRSSSCRGSSTASCPAKLGDVYRAYLLKINSTGVAEPDVRDRVHRAVLDLFAIAILGLAAGFWSFRDGLPPAIQIVFAIGLVVVVVLAVGLFTMRNFGRRIIIALPLPHRVLELYDRFEEGVFGAVGLRAAARSSAS